MRFGFHMFGFPPDEFRDIAIACDASGWDHVAFGDNPFNPKVVRIPYPHSADGKRFWDLTDPVLDPWIAITHMATVTKRMRFMPAVLRMGIRKPLMEGKMACSVASVANDRLAIGVGLGWMPEEFEFTNEQMSTRGARLDEAIDILKLCLGGGFIEYHGKYYDFDSLIMEPHPKTKVPIYVGGHADNALRRAALKADGWLGLLHPFEEAKAYVRKLAALRREYGREKEPFDILLQCPDATTVDDFKRLEDIGVTHTWVVPWAPVKALTDDITEMFNDDPPLQKKIDAIKRYGDEVIAKF